MLKNAIPLFTISVSKELIDYYSIQGSAFGILEQPRFWFFEIKNGASKRIARNVHARLKYEHLEDSFNVDPACWLIPDSGHRPFHPYANCTDLAPGEMQKIALAARRRENGIFITNAVKVEQHTPEAAQTLASGKWIVNGSISADNCDLVEEISLSFCIDEDGNLKDLCLFDVRQKLNKKPRPQTKTPNHDEHVIIGAINEGCRGISFCRALDEGEVKPRRGWEDRSNPYPWPGSYVNAYTTNHVRNKLFWKKRINDYKNDTQTKFLKLIHRTKQPKNSPTRQGE